MKVAVIGAGAAGIVCARELVREGHDVTVFEQSNRVGGVWVYDKEQEDDLLGLTARKSVFSSLYDSLRTNLPRDLMAFLDYTFDTNGGGDDNWQRFPHHSKVLQYLENFVGNFNVLSLIRFNEKVMRITQFENHQWRVESSTKDEFDALAICNGHYSKPRVPAISGLERFKGQVLHSHNYRNNQDFGGQRVAVFGAAASGVDIAREIADVAEQVYWCADKFELPPKTISQNIHLYPRPSALTENNLVFDRTLSGEVVCIENIDTFVFCTGYKYDFPFFDSDIVSTTDNYVHPLYQDLLSPNFPNLAFIGLPFLIVPFPVFEIQSRWFAKLLSGKVPLPEQQKMLQEIDTRLESHLASGSKLRHIHKLGDDAAEYMNRLAAQCGETPLPSWFFDLSKEAQEARMANPREFRESKTRFHGPTQVP
ncbi:MAG: thioredoxin reductase [Flavobacterium sp.]